MSLTSVAFTGETRMDSSRPAVSLGGYFFYDSDIGRVVVGRLSSAFGTNVIINFM